MRKPGDIEMIFSRPEESYGPLGQARLHKFLSSDNDTELWLVEFLDQPEQFFEKKLKKISEPIKSEYSFETGV